MSILPVRRSLIPSKLSRSRVAGAASLLVLGCALLPALAQGGEPTPVIGSTNTVTADPPVARPHTTPCRVSLFSSLAFNDYSPRYFTYAPPAACAGPWAKVVLEGDFSVNAGIQYDRTANLWLGGTNIYFGTTQEPTPTVAPSWHVERDLTDYSALFTSSQNGEADVFNIVNSTYTGVITGSVNIAFYPLERSEAPPVVADAVLPLSAGPTGETVSLNTPTDTLSKSLTLPTNVERAYLDVIAQGQQSDEFWYSCVPDALVAATGACTGTGFRETEISIDGTPAGVAPVYPWIFTGGFDPSLWEPIPGVQTLDMKPYRVDLTPFAGLLSNGAAHTVSLGVVNADQYFSATATLLLYEDHGRKKVTGAVTSNTLSAAPAPVVNNGVQTAADGSVSGTVTVTSSRRFAIAGYVDTSHGRVTTEVSQDVAFSNAQAFTINATTYAQDVTQKSSVATITTTRSDAGEQVTVGSVEWPLTANIDQVQNSDGTYLLTFTVKQTDKEGGVSTVDGFPLSYDVLSNEVSSQAALTFDADGNFTGVTTSSNQSYFQTGTDERCYSRTLASSNNALTGVTNGAECGP